MGSLNRQHNLHAAQRKESFAAWLFMLPFLALYAAFLLFPIFRGLYTSFTNARLVGSVRFIGLENYAEMLADKDFWGSMGNTLYFVLISTPTIVVVGFILAMLINSKLKGTTFLRTAYFSSYVLSMSVVTGLWIFIFQPYTGLINTIVTRFGGQEIFWLSTRGIVWLAILMTTVWWTVGFDMVLFLAALQNIPSEMYEAAEIDGASKAQVLFKITIPMLRESTVLVVMLQMIASFKLFGQTYLMAGGGPGTHTRTIVHYIYESGFTNRRLGYASTMSIAFFLVVLGFSLLQRKLFANKEGR
ncbi:MAG: sugar ABC transporter permease [Spirochaetales bacterium]|jgi:multiple sugar transport system permease protein|nr:sugar ABC transporter permease [Spirochaetales bacterium]